MKFEASMRSCLGAGRGPVVAAFVALACSPTSDDPAGAKAPVVVEPEGEANPTPRDPLPSPTLGGGSMNSTEAGFDDLIEPGDPPVSDPGAPLERRGLLDRQVTCPDGGTTSVSGTVYVPSGALPVYNVMVYVPDAELEPLTPGASCSCEVSGAPIASAVTDANGHFVLENVPTGEHVPLVIQVGDWRREFDIGIVEPCTETALEDQLLRLPSRQSEGDLPRIAVATGGADALECLMLKLGVDLSEFTTPADGGRVHLFAGQGGADEYAEGTSAGAPFPPAQALWWDAPSLGNYDLVLLSCDGREGYIDNKGEFSREAMHEYLNLGGRVFASHFQSVWLERGPGELPELAEIVEDEDSSSTVNAEVVTSFPKGQALSEWLWNAGGSAEPGFVEILAAQNTIVAENPDYAQRWIQTESSVQYMSANTPLGAPDEEQCGRVVLSDIHLSPGRVTDNPDGLGVVPLDDLSAPSLGFPEGCVTSEISPQEAVLAFMLFDLSACIVPDDRAPTAPPIIR